MAGIPGRLASATALCASDQYDQALDVLEALMELNGADMSTQEWSSAYLLAGYAYDRKGLRDRALECYTVCAALAEDASPVQAWAERGLVSPLTATPFGKKR